MTLQELVDVVAVDQNITKKSARESIDKVFSIIAEQVKDGGEVKLPGFGRFFRTETPARTVKVPSPNGLVEKQLPAAWSIRFRPGKDLKGKV